MTGEHGCSSMSNQNPRESEEEDGGAPRMISREAEWTMWAFLPETISNPRSLKYRLEIDVTKDGEAFILLLSL